MFTLLPPWLRRGAWLLSIGIVLLTVSLFVKHPLAYIVLLGLGGSSLAFGCLSALFCLLSDAQKGA